MYDKDVVWVNVSGCFNRGNLVGRFFIVELFGEFGFTNTWPDPLGAKVNDWYWTSKTQNAALEDQVAQMQHHSSFRQVLTLDSQDNEENDSSDDDDIGLSFEDNDDFEDDADDSENGEEEEDREENRSFQSSPNHSESFLHKPGKKS